MKKRLQGLIAGTLLGIILTSGIAIASNTTTLYNVKTNGIKIFVDGQKINPKDGNGKPVEPFIYNGTTYLPVRAIADALGKAVYWDGPTYTVYLGKMDGNLDYPTTELSIDDNIGDYFWENSNKLKDNYGNYYSQAIFCDWNNMDYNATYEKLCNMKYSRFKGTIYVEEGSTLDTDVQISIKADGKTIYTSPAMNKRTAPTEFDVNITGCNVLQIIQNKRVPDIHIGDAGFYQ